MVFPTRRFLNISQPQHTGREKSSSFFLGSAPGLQSPSTLKILVFAVLIAQGLRYPLPYRCDLQAQTSVVETTVCLPPLNGFDSCNQQILVKSNKLANLSNLRQSTIENIINGASKNPQAKTLHKIANTFNMTLAEFLDFNELNDYSFDDESDDV